MKLKRNIFNWKSYSTVLVLALAFTVCIDTSAQTIVSDPWQQMLTDYQNRMLANWHTYQAELLGKMWQEANKTNQYLDYLRNYEHQKMQIKGDPKNVRTRISDESVALNIKDYDSIKEDIEQTTENESEKDKAVILTKMYDKAAQKAIEGTKQASIKRSVLINDLQGAIRRLSRAQTESEVMKINGEISALNASINALRDEELAQFRALSYVREKGIAESSLKYIEKEKENRRKWKEELKEESKERKELIEQAENNPEDRSNPFSAIVKPVAHDDTDWSFKNEYLSGDFDFGFKGGSSISTRKEYLIESIEENEELTEEQKEKLLELLEDE